MLLVIIASFVVLALRDPFSHPQEGMNFNLIIFEIIIYIIFFLECVVKIIANGLVFNGWDSYLFSLMNLLDVILLVFEAVYLFKMESFCFKILRLLRFFQVGPYAKNLSLVLKTTLLSLPYLCKLLVILILIMIGFSVFAIKCLKGAMYFCEGFAEEEFGDLIRTRADCFDYGGDWLIRELNFDNLSNSFLTLFFVSATENWLPILYMICSLPFILTNSSI